MENYDTFTPSNIFEIENWIIVGQAMAKMATFFWPVLVMMAFYCWLENRKGAVK